MGTALITGAARRIGKAIAEDLGSRGWNVAIHYNGSEADAAAVAETIKTSGGDAIILQADLRDHDAVAGLIPATVEQWGGIDLLVNNASLFEDDGPGDVTAESWHNHIDANLTAPLFLAQAFAAAQTADKNNANIINILDQRVWRLTPRFLSYTVSKTGLWTLTRTLAQGLAPNIRVNGIGPGPTLRNDRQSEDHFARQQAGTILKRGADLSEITDAVQFILSARSMTGQMIALDGGQHLAWETPDIIGIPE